MLQGLYAQFIFYMIRQLNCISSKFCRIVIDFRKLSCCGVLTAVLRKNQKGATNGSSKISWKSVNRRPQHLLFVSHADLERLLHAA
jgi:hypothetical protein